ncbi:MAG: TIGR03936 family radical SAM-associated protein [Defluviitaleaceae bacterium]|nr:TIGR03936 family radical SAM-associated protein [Defluviitaleaceae bacterium]
MKQSYYRYRITFAKEGAARFLGHLDLQSLFQKAIKRAKLPVGYSEGFNPHQLLSFAAPLPLGMAGKAEILEVFLTHEVTEGDIVTALDAQMPLGMTIRRATHVPSIGKSAAALMRIATYSIAFSAALGLDEIIVKIMNTETIVVRKKSKKGMSTADIRPDIFDLAVVGKALHATLACGSERNLKPEVLAQYILQLAGIAPEDCDITYERLEIGLK